jgi:hypothetical protein
VIDDMTPWLAQQGVVLGSGATVALASLAWIGVRGLSWYLFARAGAPALAAALERSATKPATN